MSSQVVRTRKIEVYSWNTAGIWLDVILVAMVVASVLGLAYTFIMH